MADAPVKEFVIKAQVHAGGRGKGYFIENGEGTKGGVQFGNTYATPILGTSGHRPSCFRAEDCAAAAEVMLGKHLWTNQTPAGGCLTSQVTRGVSHRSCVSLLFLSQYHEALHGLSQYVSSR